MADVLSKISGRQQTNVEQIPQELKEVIRNIIRQSFSIESTLAQGLGSTAASQRFSTDQLTTLARMLNQMGTMAETNEVPRVSDDVATLLAALKSAIAKDAGGTFEPIMLTKAAFQLIECRTPPEGFADRPLSAECACRWSTCCGKRRRYLLHDVSKSAGSAVDAA